MHVDNCKNTETTICVHMLAEAYQDDKLVISVYHDYSLISK